MHRINVASKEVHYGDVGGVSFYVPSRSKGAVFVIWNQWRSGAKSLFSKQLAQLLLQDKRVYRIVFLDRIASGGLSRDKLTSEESQQMKITADMQFSAQYAKAVASAASGSDVYVCGSSGGALAVIAAINGASSKQKPCRAVIVEPVGMKKHGISMLPGSALAAGVARHAWAYRHRMQRRWWTKMDREQYFAKGHPTEKRAMYFVTNAFFQELTNVLRKKHPVLMYISNDSHLHSVTERNELQNILTHPHKLALVNGNHDSICQPSVLAGLYLSAL